MQRSEIEWMPIASIRPYEKNSRRNDDTVERSIIDRLNAEG